MKNPAAPPEIEITPAMIEAGRRVAYQSIDETGRCTSNQTLAAIFTAMLKART